MDNTNDIIKQMPVSIEAEQAVLGAILIDPECLNYVTTQIKEEYFYCV